MRSTSNVSSTCQQVKGLLNKDIVHCAKEACSMGANVINYVPGVCELRKCEDVQNPEYTTMKGGWDVYVLGNNGSLPEDVSSQDTKSSQLNVIALVVAGSVVLTIILSGIGAYVNMTRIKQSSRTGKAKAEGPTNVEFSAKGDNLESAEGTDVRVYDVIPEESPYEQLNDQSRDQYMEPYSTVKNI